MPEKPKPTTLSIVAPLIKEVYEDQLNYQLNRTLFFLPREPPPPLTRKQKLVRKWKRFWNHIPDFIDFIKEYKYEDWRYWDRDGF